MKAKELKEACCHIRDPLEKKKEVFTKKLLPRHPPVLGEWFRKTFPDAQVQLFTVDKINSFFLLAKFVLMFYFQNRKDLSLKCL